ncbi:MAG: twin transmembrane helix small protein [Gammaproteobacteria bacterium]|nr:MAG: twin transmembrane helix small protein [Gammaproteobacteria bacterium]
MFVKMIVVAMMLSIVFSLGYGLVALIQDKGHTNRTVKALTWRISLSVALFSLLMLGSMLGLIQPHAPGF